MFEWKLRDSEVSSYGYKSQMASYIANECSIRAVKVSMKDIQLAKKKLWSERKAWTLHCYIWTILLSIKQIIIASHYVSFTFIFITVFVLNLTFDLTLYLFLLV